MVATLGAISNQISNRITKAVSEFYEEHPYPNYPLFAKPKIEDAYLSTAGFAKRLQFHSAPPNAFQEIPAHKNAHRILLAGCGEILPYIIRRSEPITSHILAVDLSKQSLRRARFRLGLFSKNIEFRQQDVLETLYQTPGNEDKFSHVDAYGVLHHLANPSSAVNGIADSLTADGTVRVMVYNSQARDWIHQLQRVFQLMRLDNHQRQDYKDALKFIKEACKISPALQAKIAGVGPFTLNNRSRFCDTFLHVREARISYERWSAMFSQAGLRPFALFDRYGELDDLPNPLWKVPSPAEFFERIADRRFENNFELYLCRTDIPLPAYSKLSRSLVGAKNSKWNSQISTPSPFQRFPHNWATFKETRDIPRSLFRSLWELFQLHSRSLRSDFFDELLLRQFPPDAIQRLARIGAILPQMVHTEELRDLAFSPITDKMEVPEAQDNPLAFPEKLRTLTTKVLLERNIFSEKLLSTVMSRLLNCIAAAKTSMR
jgi:SAM-dependent methyltransferase